MAYHMEKYLRYLPIVVVASTVLTAYWLWPLEYDRTRAGLARPAHFPDMHELQPSREKFIPSPDTQTSRENFYLQDHNNPLHDGMQTLRCGEDCPESCQIMFTNENKLQPVCSNESSLLNNTRMSDSTTLYVSNPPYENYFYSDRNVAAHVVVTSPLPDSNLKQIGPRLIVAWPAGNSGVCAFFAPENGVNSSLGIQILNSTIGTPLEPVYISTDSFPSVGVKGIIDINSTAILSLAILGSIRAIRDFTEGPSILHPMLQKGNYLTQFGGNGVSVSRLWLDNVTTTTLTFEPYESGGIHINGEKVTFEAGAYVFSAHFNYPQLEQLSIPDVVSVYSFALEEQHEAKALSFLSYSEKLLAGAWRFLTYFGRDDMISTLLLMPVLTGKAAEAVIGSVLERINRTDGSACHEEVIGDYATFLNAQDGFASTAPRCDYNMVDTDYFVPILMHSYFVEFNAGPERLKALLSTPAGSVEVQNKGLTWGDLFKVLVRKILSEAAPFASPGGQIKENMIHIRPDRATGEWRDSLYGLGGGRIPFDVNVALVPAALQSIVSLAGAFEDLLGDEARNWSVLASQYSQQWEDNTLEFFKIVIPAEVARERLETFTNTSAFYNGPSYAELIDSDVSYHGLALEGNDGLDVVPVLNTDSCFRLFFLNGTNQSRLTDYMNSTALSILRPFPAGLMTPLGLVVANPALSDNEFIRQNFTNSAYHGTVIWSWQLVMMARGLERQLDRCTSGWQQPDFCSDKIVYNNVKEAYNSLWDVIQGNQNALSDEVWSWVYRDGNYYFATLGSLPAAPGAGGIAESDIIQLWSLTFLAVTRNVELR